MQPSASNPSSTPKVESRPVTLFRSSLRAWQARYQAQKAAQAAQPEKAINPPAPGGGC